MNRTLDLLVAAGALCAGVPLAAQSIPSADAAKAQAAAPHDTKVSGDEIVVTGKTAKPSGNDVFEEARGISRIGPHEASIVALPRFWEPVCPGVAGLRTDYAEAMVDRMRANVTRLKIPLAKGNCSPNLVVAFAEDGMALLADLKRDKPGIFRLVPESEQAELLSGQAPVRVWNNIAMRWTGNGAPPERGLKASVWGQLDRTSMPESYDIVAALVVFDRDAAEGMTVTQLADYATMRGLSHTRPASSGEPMATILSLFDKAGGGPAELTDFDIGYLRSLYWWQPNASAASKLLDVKRWAAKAAKNSAPIGVATKP